MGGAREGAGFAVRKRVVITANHVVGGRDADQLTFRPDNQPGIPDVKIVKVKPYVTYDIAVLYLADDVPTDLSIGRSKSGNRWSVSTRSLANDPDLTGRVEVVKKLIENSGGHRVHVTQLHADQNLGTFAGYSGAAVFAAGTRKVTDVLIEQVMWRRPAADSSVPVSNVLYAVPVTSIVKNRLQPWRAAIIAMLTAALIAAGSNPLRSLLGSYVTIGPTTSPGPRAPLPSGDHAEASTPGAITPHTLSPSTGRAPVTRTQSPPNMKPMLTGPVSRRFNTSFELHGRGFPCRAKALIAIYFNGPGPDGALHQTYGNGETDDNGDFDFMVSVQHINDLDGQVLSNQGSYTFFTLGQGEWEVIAKQPIDRPECSAKAEARTTITIT